MDADTAEPELLLEARRVEPEAGTAAIGSLDKRMRGCGRQMPTAAGRLLREASTDFPINGSVSEIEPLENPVRRQ